MAGLVGSVLFVVACPPVAFAEPVNIDTSSATTAESDGQRSNDIQLSINRMNPSERKAWARSGGEERPDTSGGGDGGASNCYYRASTNPLSLQAFDHTVDEGFVLIRMCGGQLTVEDGVNGEFWMEDGSSFVSYTDPIPGIPAPPPPKPEDFIESAKNNLELPLPEIHIGPDAQNAVVNLPLSFWVGGQTEYQATAGLAGGVGVVVTARMKSVNWNFGEPASTASPTGAAATLTCNGPGTPATATADRQETPDCGHAFRWKSTADRTGGKGSWTIGASVQWDVTWQSTGVDPVVTGVVGDVAPTQNTAQLQVLEYRDRLVDNPNAAPGG